MNLPPRLLDAIYARAMESGDYYVEFTTSLPEVRRVIAQRFVDAIDEVMLEESEEVASE